MLRDAPKLQIYWYECLLNRNHIISDNSVFFPEPNKIFIFQIEQAIIEGRFLGVSKKLSSFKPQTMLIHHIKWLYLIP